MRRPLFFKLFLSVCVSFIVVSYFVWLADALLSQSPSRSTDAQAQIALAGASSRHPGGRGGGVPRKSSRPGRPTHANI